LDPAAISTTSIRPATISNDDKYVDDSPHPRSSPSPRLSGGTHEVDEGPDRVLADHTSPPSLPTMASSMDEDVEDDDRAPIPLDMIAASFEDEPSQK